MKLILELSEKLKFTKEELRAGRVVQAAEAVRELKVALQIRDNAGEEEEGREPVVFSLLRKEWMECFEEIQEVLVRFMEKVVTFDKNSNAVCVKYQSSVNRADRVELQNFLKAMVFFQIYLFRNMLEMRSLAFGMLLILLMVNSKMNSSASDLDQLRLLMDAIFGNMMFICLLFLGTRVLPKASAVSLREGELSKRATTGFTTTITTTSKYITTRHAAKAPNIRLVPKTSCN